MLKHRLLLIYFAVKFIETFWNICAGGVTLSQCDSVQERKKNKIPRRCESADRPTWAGPSHCFWYNNWRVPKSRMIWTNYLNAVSEIGRNVDRSHLLLKQKCKPRAWLNFTTFFTWIPVMIHFDLFWYTFTLGTLALPQHRGKNKYQ